MKRIAVAILAVLGLLAVSGIASVLWLRSEGGRAWIAQEIGRLASTPGEVQVSVGRLDGDLFRQIALSGITASDAGGVWLTVRSVAVDWHPFDLLFGRLTLDRADIREATVHRLPETAASAKEPTLAERLDTLRSLPAIRIARISVEDLTLGEPVLGEHAALRVAGRVESEAAAMVRGALSIRRVDGHAGSLEAKGEYRASGDALTLDVTLAEPSGGLLARVLDIPDLPPLNAEAKGGGALSDWRGHAALSFERAASMRADLAIRHATATAFDITGTATIPDGGSGFLRRIASGEHRFRAAGSYADAAVTLSQLQWTASAFDLAATGTLQLDDLAIDGRASMRTTGGTPLTLTPAGATVGALTAEATASGRLPAPDLRLSFDANRLSVPDVVAADAAGAFTFKPDSRESGRLEGSATLKSAVWTGRPAVQALLGGEAALQIAALVDDRYSELRVETARISARPGALSGNGLFNWDSGDGTAKATLTIPDLAAFRPTVGMPLAGRASISLDAAVRGFGASATAAITGKAADLALGSALAEAVLARDADLAAALSLTNGKLDAKRVVVKSGAAQVQLDGTLDTASRAVAAAYRMSIGGAKPISLADGVVAACACRASGQLRGTLDELGVTGSLAVQTLRLRDIALRALSAEYDIANLTGEPGGTVKVKSETPVGTATAQTKVALAQDRLRLKDLQVEGGTARLRGTLDVPFSDAPVAGDLGIEIADLTAWLAAAGLDGTGKASAQVKLRADGKRQSLDAAAKVDGLRFRGGPGAPVVSVEQAAVDATARDLRAGSGNKIELRIAKAGVGAAAFERIVATAEGSLTQAKLSLAAKGDWKGPLAADASAEYSEKAGRRALDVATFRGTLVGEKFLLQQPLHLAWADTGFTAEPLALSFGEARLTGHMRTGRRDADISLAAAGVPLKLIDRFWPLGLDGKAEAALTLKGPWPEPVGKLSLSIPSLRFNGEADAPAMSVGLDGDWRRGRLALDGKIDAGSGDPSVVEASIPLRLEGPGWNFSMPREQPVSGTLRWAGETAKLWRFVPATEHLLRGPGKIDMKLVGTLARPALEGSIAIANGYYESLEYGTVLRPLDLAIAFDGRQARIARFSAGDGGEGKLDGAGTIALDPEAGFPFDLSAKLDKLTAVRRDVVEASASGNIKIAGSLRKARIESAITTELVEIRVLDRLPPEVVTLDVVEVGGAGTLPPPKKVDSAPPFDADLAIDIAMPRRVFVRGRGIDSEWKGNIKIGGTASKPAVAGYLALVRGQMTVVGKTFHLSDGSLFLPEDAGGEPEISVAAVYSARDLTVRAQVEGPVSTPKITLSSTPSLPQEEIVSHVLFNKSASNLSVYEAAQLGLALAELTGAGGSGGVLDFVRKTIGVDTLQIESTETSKGSVPVVGAGKYLTDDVYVGVKQGATPDSSSVGVEVELTPNISVESEVKRSGQSDVGVKFKLDY
ncbi:MAG: hypothetical protein GEU87_04975 [Alphaproteobacteria bacterium]|nr:hypothetical protein [Alphaproteobacteria bacterium]